MQLEKAAETTFIQKICTLNVDEIDTWQHDSSCKPAILMPRLFGRNFRDFCLKDSWVLETFLHVISSNEKVVVVIFKAKNPSNIIN